MFMMFWGLTIEPGKHYTQTVEESFHVSMAAMETRDHVAESGGEKTGVVQVIVKHEKAEFLVCSLFYGTVFQQPLDLNFTEGEEVTFFTEGRGIVHLTGYLVKEEPLDIDQDMMSLEDASSSEDIGVSSEGLASGEESPGQPQAAKKSCKRKKKRSRWKVKDNDSRRGRSRYHRRKRMKTERDDRTNPQRLPRQKNTDAKELEPDQIGVHLRKWTTTIVGDVRTETAGSNRTSTFDKESDVAVSDKVSSVLSSQDEDVIRTSKKFDKTIDGKSDQINVLPQQGGEIGSVVLETINKESSSGVTRTRESIHFFARPPVPKNSEQHCVNQPTQSVKNVLSATQPTPRTVTSDKSSSLDSTTQQRMGTHRTREQESVQPNQAVEQMLQSDSDVKEEEEEEEDVLIEEIKIEDDSSDEEPSFSSAPPSSSSTMPRITSVTSMSNQQQQRFMGNQGGSSMMYQESASWNVPGPSRGGMSLHHSGSLLPDQFIPPVPLPSQAPHPVTLSMHDDQGAVMGGVDEDEEGEVVFSDEVLRAMPVATEMGELGPEDMQVNGLDISQQQILLARGYRVFLTRGQLYEVQIAARETTKTPWSVCVRRLMDIYFDRQTLAMGKATSHGFSNNPARKTLNQEVIQAIKAYTSSVYDEALTSIQRAMTYYVCNIRKSLRLEQSNYATVEAVQNNLFLPDAAERPGSSDNSQPVNVEFL